MFQILGIVFNIMVKFLPFILNMNAIKFQKSKFEFKI